MGRRVGPGLGSVGVGEAATPFSETPLTTVNPRRSINRPPVPYFRALVSNPRGCSLVWILPRVILVYLN